jgi:hypothetical protein
MGNSASQSSPPVPYDRNLYVSLIKYQEIKRTFTSFYVYTFSLGYHRFKWHIQKRFHEFKLLDKHLRKKYPNTMDSISLPSSSSLFSVTSSSDGLTKRGTELSVYLEFIAQNDLIFEDKDVKIFLEIGAVDFLSFLLLLTFSTQTSFLPELGRKGKAGYLQRVGSFFFPS